jgi:hypothetical protein
MPDDIYEVFPSKAEYNAAYDGIDSARKAMNAEADEHRLTRITIGVGSTSVIWGEFGVCNADFTSIPFVVLDVAAHTYNSVANISPRELAALLLIRRTTTMWSSI